jgi:hypothetical protein
MAQTTKFTSKMNASTSPARTADSAITRRLRFLYSVQLALLGCSLSVSACALAGPDAGQVLAQEKASKQVAAESSELAKPDSLRTDEALPLDHGPHAVTTPRVNKQRKLHREAAASAVADRPSPKQN